MSCEHECLPEIQCGNILYRPVYFAEAGAARDGHTHHFDHATIVLRGRVRVDRKHPDGATDSVTVAAADPALLIRAECEHTLTALTDDTLVWCVYSHRDPQGQIVQTCDGWDREQFPGLMEAYT